MTQRVLSRGALRLGQRMSDVGGETALPVAPGGILWTLELTKLVLEIMVETSEKNNQSRSPLR